MHATEGARDAGHADRAWQDLLVRAGLDGAWGDLDPHTDDDLYGSFHLDAALVAETPDDVARGVGRRVARGLAARHPELVVSHAGTRSFLASLDALVGARDGERLWVLPGATVTRTPGGGTVERLQVRYRSPRRLCALTAGVIEGSPELFGQRAHVEHDVCQHRGAPHCILRVTVQAG